MSFYNRTKSSVNAGNKTRHQNEASGNVLVELVLLMEDILPQENTSPVFRFADLAKLNLNRMQQLVAFLDTRIHMTRRKERFLAWIQGLQAQSKG